MCMLSPWLPWFGIKVTLSLATSAMSTCSACSASLELRGTLVGCAGLIRLHCLYLLFSGFSRRLSFDPLSWSWTPVFLMATLKVQCFFSSVSSSLTTSLPLWFNYHLPCGYRHVSILQPCSFFLHGNSSFPSVYWTTDTLAKFENMFNL